MCVRSCKPSVSRRRDQPNSDKFTNVYPFDGCLYHKIQAKSIFYMRAGAFAFANARVLYFDLIFRMIYLCYGYLAKLFMIIMTVIHKKFMFLFNLNGFLNYFASEWVLLGVRFYGFTYCVRVWHSIQANVVLGRHHDQPFTFHSTQSAHIQAKIPFFGCCCWFCFHWMCCAHNL